MSSRKFSDKALLKNVENARQALSLEDDRKTFHPIPWDETAEKNLVKNGRLSLVGCGRFGLPGLTPMLAAAIRTTWRLAG